MFWPSTHPSCLIDIQNWLVETDFASCCGLGTGPRPRIPTRAIFCDFCASAASGATRRPPARPPTNARRLIIMEYALGDVNRCSASAAQRCIPSSLASRCACSRCTMAPPALPRAAAERSVSILERSGARDDDLRPVGLLAEDRDVGARLTALNATPRDDPARGERLVRPQHIGELHVQAAAQVETPAEMPSQELGDARERHAAADHRILEAEFLRGSLVVVIVRAAVEELVAHRFGERLVELDGQRLPGRLVSLPRALLVRRISQRDLAAGLLRQEALVMDAARDQVPGLVPHPHLLRD